eukprot:TRINITY_DN23486_c0_g3_i1.p1 TRINITY_DN23486_c0_g3~~TRINITY_DN23486_c0_g3_i1.p1  ORF type:complete len:233 (-),score=29.24 TRINITY_DN23486_c0_g3_i1:154-852(-)
MDEIDPDEVYSVIPYEKGFLFLVRLENAVGRAAFDAFISKYIRRFAFQSINTGTFLDFLKQELPGIENKVDLEEWVRGQGMPVDAVLPQSDRLAEVQRAAAKFSADPVKDPLNKASAAGWGPDEWQIFLGGLPAKLPVEALVKLNEEFGLAKSKNAELRSGFLNIATRSGATQFLPEVEATLRSVGRMKYLKPLYKALLEGGQKSEAARIFELAKGGYHPVAQAVVGGLMKA